MGADGREQSAGGIPNVPPGAAKRPPWMTEDQYEAFIKNFAMDLGAQCITAWSIGVEHLDEDQRREVLSGVAIRPMLRQVCVLYASLDAAAQRAREGEGERSFVQSADGELAQKVGTSLRAGNRLMPPPAMNQLLREVIEWCSDADNGSTERDGCPDDQGGVSSADLIRLVLSINGDQEREYAPEYFDTWPPATEELEKYNEAMSVDDEMVLREMQNQMVLEFARMQTNAMMLPVMVLGDTYDTWFKGWPPAAPHNLIGDTPPAAFAAATGVALRDFANLGLHLWGQAEKGDVEFTRTRLLDLAVGPEVTDKLKNTASMPLAKYRKRLEKERKKGALAHRRYTFSECPIIEFADEEFIVLRPSWVLDRFCGQQLYWDTFFSFGTEKDPRGEQFSQSMNYVFEATVGYLFRRATKRANKRVPGSITLITESEMQEAWRTGGNTPSVCDWVLVSGKYCLLVDATNHWLDEKAAQGYATAEEYQVDVEDTFVNKKFEQLKSTINLLSDHGWEGCTFDVETVYVRLVVVPNAGVPATVFADIDTKMRAHPVLGQLGKNVTSPGILIYFEMQVFEGLCEHRFPQRFVDVIAQWRLQCTAGMPIRPQSFLALGGMDRPLSGYPTIARNLLMKALA